MELLVGMLAAWGLITLIWTLAGAALLPIRRRENLRLAVILRGKAGLTQMERWLRGLIWLRESGLIWWNIVILTDELEDETLEYVRNMEQQGYIKGLTKEQWKDWVDS